jgi:hypothetical protein
LFPCSGRIVVIDALRLLPARTLLSETVDLVVLAFKGLTPDRLAGAAPDLVAAPLVGAGYSIVDVLSLLSEAGYSGPVVALTRPVKAPTDLTAAIAAKARGRAVWVVEIGQGGEILAVSPVTDGQD